MRFDPSRHVNLQRANSYSGMHPELYRLETAYDIKDQRNVFVLDRKEIISDEDAFALSSGKEQLKSLTNIRRR
jgi:hypothetical protein